MSSVISFLLILTAIIFSTAVVVALVAVPIVFFVLQKKRKEQKKLFVLEHSKAIARLRAVNAKYVFYIVPDFLLQHSYDNANFYETISPKDYLTYQLVYKKREITEGMRGVAENAKIYPQYTIEADAAVISDGYNAEVPFKKAEDLAGIEQELLRELYLKPTIVFRVTVILNQTDLRGRVFASKSNVFSASDVESVLNGLNDKRGSFYRNEEIWQAICRVERGRVSNKMRFAVYQRDGNRCRKCGKTGNDLEVDHIFPIAKGGKSEFDNLQTLCHRCNAQKGATVESGAVNPKAKWQGVSENCTFCGAPLVLKKGKYGSFYSCSNYPRCKFTRKA